MKSISLRHVFALALALSLSACGGGKATFTVAGTVFGLQYGPLVLTTNGQDTTVNPDPTVKPPVADVTKTPVPNVTFQFAKQLEYGDEYDVTVKTAAPHQDCIVSPTYEKDTAGRLASINIPVSCTLQQHLIGGTITGLTADGLVLTNGSTGGTFTAPSGSTGFTFGSAVQFGDTYGVTVLSNPPGLYCSVANGSGKMGDEPVSTIAVSCVPAT
jgi:hypothetical protein